MSHDIYVTINSPTPIEASIVESPTTVSLGPITNPISIGASPISVSIGGPPINISINNPIVIGGSERILIVPIFGSLVALKTLLTNFYFDTPVIITKLGIHLDTAPIGGNVTIDLLKNDILKSRIATLVSGSRGSTTNIIDISYSIIEKFDIKVLTTGVSEPGEGGTIAVHYK